MRVPEAYGNRNRNRRRLIWFIIKVQMDQPQSFGDFAHGNYTGYDGRTPS